MHTPQAVLIDTDPGIDDAMALAFLRARRDVRIVAITTIFGNADIATTTRNACYLAARLDIDAPVITGADRPLQIERLVSPTHVHGHDGLGDVLGLQPFRELTGEQPAYAHIIQRVRSMPHQLTLLALGPLTNLALALQADPEIAKLVRQVIVMGGAFGWHGRGGNVSPVAEANIRNDPHAAKAVLAASWPVTMVGLDVTTRCVLSTAGARQLADASLAGRLLWDISRGYEALYKEHDGLAGCCLHDVAAAACLVDPTLFATRSGSISVATEGEAIGQTVLGSELALPRQQACSDVDAARLMDLYEQTLRDGPG